MKNVDFGIFMWDGDERRSNRYGSFYLTSEPYNNDVHCEAVTHGVVLGEFRGKRVRVVAEIVESRDSSHIGDLFLGIFPERPEVGDAFEIVVADLAVGVGPDAQPAFIMVPDDGRSELWIDPRVLYMLHDQTVQLYIEETADECSVAPVVTQEQEDGVVGAVPEEHSFQVKGDNMPAKVGPVFERIGEGLFVSRPAKMGEPVPFVKKDES